MSRQLPPFVLKMLEQIVEQEKQQRKRVDEIEQEIRDAIAELDVSVSHTGSRVVGVLAGALRTVIENTPHPDEGCEYRCTPTQAVSMADRFMLRWAATRNSVPPPDEAEDGVVDELFADVQEVKIV